MVDNSSIHPSENMLIDRARILGLGSKEINILRDLLGWAGFHGGTPVYRRSILPQMILTTEYADASEARKRQYHVNAAKIGNLIRRLIGQDLVAKMQPDPAGVLQNDLGLPATGAAWIIVQLGLKTADREINAEIGKMQYLAPEQVAPRIVVPVLSCLLDKAQP